MKGSGLEEVLGLIFGPNTVEHVLSGKAYARAVRGHFLIHAALTEILIDYLRNSVSDDLQPSPVALGSDLTQSMAGSLSNVVMSEIDMLYE